MRAGVRAGITRVAGCLRGKAAAGLQARFPNDLRWVFDRARPSRTLFAAAEQAGVDPRRTVENPPPLAVLLQAGLKPRAG
jgi:hypothetical protein